MTSIPNLILVISAFLAGIFVGIGGIIAIVIFFMGLICLYI